MMIMPGAQSPAAACVRLLVLFAFLCNASTMHVSPAARLPRGLAAHRSTSSARMATEKPLSLSQMFEQLFLTETAEQQAEREVRQAAEAKVKAAEEAREAARVAREGAEARLKAAAEAEELRVSVLFGPWLTRYVHDDTFDEAAYNKTVGMAIREKGIADAKRKAETAATAAEIEGRAKVRAAEEEAEARAVAAAARAGAVAKAKAKAGLLKPSRQREVLAEWKEVGKVSSWYDAGVRLWGKSATTGGNDESGASGGLVAGLALVAAAGYYISTGSFDLGNAPSFNLDTSGAQKQLQAAQKQAAANRAAAEKAAEKAKTQDEEASKATAKATATATQEVRKKVVQAAMEMQTTAEVANKQASKATEEAVEGAKKAAADATQLVRGKEVQTKQTAVARKSVQKQTTGMQAKAVQASADAKKVANKAAIESKAVAEQAAKLRRVRD